MSTTDRQTTEREDAADRLLDDYRRACERVVVQGDSNLSRTTKERAILRNLLRQQLLRRPETPAHGDIGRPVPPHRSSQQYLGPPASAQIDDDELPPVAAALESQR